MSEEKKFIDANYLDECMAIVQKANKDSVEFNRRCRATDVFMDIWDMIKNQPAADVVEKSKYDKLKAKYDRLLENANYLAEAVREYQKREEEEHGN